MAGNGWRKLIHRLEGREDSEHGQAIVRLAIVLLILAYLWWLAQRLPSVAPMFAVMLAESLVGLGLVAWLLVKPGVSHVRRWIGMLADFSTLAILMLLNPKPLAPLYVLILWVVVGNGLRYGPRYLYSAAGLGFLAFLSVIFGNPYWRDQPYLAVGLLVGVIAIPMYLSSLLRDLHRVTEEARRANAAKTLFLATMSHELRSPLNGIIGMAELMRSTKMSVEQREFAEVIHASAQTLRLLVDDVLDIAAIEAGKLQRKESVFSLSDLINRLELLLHPQAAEKGITLDTRIASDVPDRLYGDAAHLTQILMNLLHNAVKFTDSGGVLLEVAKREASEHVVGLRFSVRDTGSGIPDEDKARIFDAFEQVDNGVTRRHGGSGLGTTIASTLAGLLGGKVGLEDNSGGGSHFWLDVEMEPLSVVDEGRDAEAAANVVPFDDPFVRHRARVKPLRILIADDQLANRTVLVRILERAGHLADSAVNGEDVLDRLAENDYDLAILDMHMPAVSGIDVVRQLRVMQAGLPNRTPVIILSADATEQAFRDAMDAGAHLFLSKPVVVARLLESIADAVDSTAKKRSLEPSEPSGIARTRPAMLEELAQMNLGDEFLVEFVEQCLRDANGSLLELDRTARKNNWGDYRDAAHSLKGVAENLGASAISERCAAMMHASDAMLLRDGLRWSSELQIQITLAAEQSRRDLARILGEDHAGSHAPGQAPDA